MTPALPPPGQRLALASTKIRKRTYSIGRISVTDGSITVERIKAKADAATYVGQYTDVRYFLTLHGLSEAEAESFMREGLKMFDEREATERAARRSANKN